MLTEDKCRKVLKEMKHQKSPRSDGLTSEFSKIFWEDMKQFYVKSINFSYQNGQLTELQNQSIISLIPKLEKGITYLESWRPVSLLNVDYEIATKAIANRVNNRFTQNYTQL